MVGPHGDESEGRKGAVGGGADSSDFTILD
jgi:hypothetical protein